MIWTGRPSLSASALCRAKLSGPNAKGKSRAWGSGRERALVPVSWRCYGRGRGEREQFNVAGRDLRQVCGDHHRAAGALLSSRLQSVGQGGVESTARVRVKGDSGRETVPRRSDYHQPVDSARCLHGRDHPIQHGRYQSAPRRIVERVGQAPLALVGALDRNDRPTAHGMAILIMESGAPWSGG
jgi:hypothetical protein